MKEWRFRKQILASAIRAVSILYGFMKFFTHPPRCVNQNSFVNKISLRQGSFFARNFPETNNEIKDRDTKIIDELLTDAKVTLN